MGIKIIRPSSRQEWLAERKNGIGSSEIATIMGVNPWQTPYQLWLNKRGEGEEVKDTAAMRAGRYLEDAVARYFEDDTDCKVDKDTAGDWCAINDARPWEMCSPDRLYTSALDGSTGVLECKTCRKPFDVEALPKNYYCQLQWQLGIMGVERGALAWLASGMDFGCAFVDFDAKFFRVMSDKAAQWWERHVVKGEAPEATTAADIRLIYPTASKTMAIASEEDVAAYHRLLELKEEKKRLEDEQKGLEEKLIFEIGGNEGIAISDKAGGLTPLATYKAQSRTTFDAKKYKEEHPDEYAQYTQTSTYRVLRLK